LNYLSGAAHTYYSGNTLINGTITLKAGKKDALTSLRLQVIQDEEVVATARLAASATKKLLIPFGDDGTISIAESQRLFALPSAEAARINGENNSTLMLKVVGKTKLHYEGEREFATVDLLVRFRGTNRFGNRDAGNCTDANAKNYPCGGDDWVLPNVRTVLAHFTSISWGDMSNMNGGEFPPHDGHQRGTSADGHFGGYNDRDAAAASQIIKYLNDDTYGSRIRRVYVTFTPAFRRAIEAVTLDDGRRATDVIKNAGDHATHFHFDIAS
jgi:hypothetical protein